MTAGSIVWGLIVLIAAVIVYRCSQPGHRRRRNDPRYTGPESRQDKTVVDYFSQPIFTRPSCKGCDKINRTRTASCNAPDCPPEEK